MSLSFLYLLSMIKYLTIRGDGYDAFFRETPDS